MSKIHGNKDARQPALKNHKHFSVTTQVGLMACDRTSMGCATSTHHKLRNSFIFRLRNELKASKW